MSNTPLDRKHEILSSLHAHLRTRTRRRRMARAAASAAGVLALAAAVYLALPAAPILPAQPDRAAITDPAPSPTIAVTVSPEGPIADHAPAAATPRVTIRIASSEPIPTTPCETDAAATVCILSDDQLLAALAEAGRPSGLVRTGDAAYVVPTGSAQPRP